MAARHEVLSWVEEQGFRPAGRVTEHKRRPWSWVLRIPTSDAVVWFKAGLGGCAFEARLLRALQAYRTPHVLLPLATDVDRGWILLPDGGPTMRETGASLEQWAAVLASYGDLQRSLERRALPGCDDLRPAGLPAVLDGLLATVPHERPDDLRALQPRFAQWCAELAESGILPTLQHDDLHPGNVLADGRVFDFGDAVLSFPFCSLLVTLRVAAEDFAVAPGSAELELLRDGYLEPWTDRHSRAELELLALLATRVAKVGRVLAWQRALRDVADPGAHAEAAPAWLEELLEPDVF